MVHVPTVDHGTIEPTTLMAAGSVLGVVNQGEALSQASLQNVIVQMQLAEAQMMGMTIPQYYIHQGTVEQIFQAHAQSTSLNTESMYQHQSVAGSNIQPTMTNSSMNTKTKKVKPDAYKPVTLTMTGQLKPSTLTKVPQVKSSPSTKYTTFNTITGTTTNGW